MKNSRLGLHVLVASMFLNLGFKLAWVHDKSEYDESIEYEAIRHDRQSPDFRISINPLGLEPRKDWEILERLFRIPRNDAHSQNTRQNPVGVSVKAELKSRPCV